MNFFYTRARVPASVMFLFWEALFFFCLLSLFDSHNSSALLVCAFWNHNYTHGERIENGGKLPISPFFG